MKVVHCKKEPYDVYCGRPGKWGNPFSHKEGTIAKYKVNTIEEAIESYRIWITKGEGMYLLKDLHELDGKVLGCWCGNFTIDSKIKRCHCQVLLDLIEKNKQNKLF